MDSMIWSRNLFKVLLICCSGLLPGSIVAQQLCKEPIEFLLESGRHPKLEQPDFSAQKETVRQFYRLNRQQMAWFDDQGFTPQGKKLLTLLTDLSLHSLSGNYYAARYWPVDQLPAAPENLSRCRLTLFDAALTIAGLRYLDTLQREDQPYLPVEQLYQLTGHDQPEQLLSDLEPHFPAYRQLRAALDKYRRLALHPAFSELLPVPDQSVHPGESYAGMAALVNRLQVWGDLQDLSPRIGDSGIYHPELETAVRHFQQRHGLTADGILGRETFRALNIPMEQRVHQIELSLLRWRQLPLDLGDRPLVVNIPQYKLSAYERQPDDQYLLSLEMDVIVGQTPEKHQTPVLSAEMSYLVFSPYWNIPYKIVRDEIYPKLQDDPDYLEKHDYEIVVDFSPATTVLPANEDNIASLLDGSLKLRQDNGSKNALGQVKFMFPNRYAVYLHDTPTKSLFRKSKRAFSHGCVRLAEPVQLAEHVLKQEQDWPLSRIEELIESGERQVVGLSRPLNVYLLYATAAADGDGKVYFFRDIYGKDQQLVQLLKEEPMALPRLASLSRRGPGPYPGE